MNQAARREFLKQASADLAALALLPILPYGDRFKVIGVAHGEGTDASPATPYGGGEWFPLERLNSGEIVMDEGGDTFIFDGVLRSLAI